MRKHLIIIGIALIALLYAPSINNNLGTATDDAYYVVLAKSIATTGTYTYVSTPHAPNAHADLPPFYPMLLAPLYLIFGMSFIAFKTLNILLALASAPLLYSIVRRRAGEHIALWTIVLTLANPLVYYFIHSIQSEIPFLFLTILTIHIYDIHSEKTAESTSHQHQGQTQKWKNTALYALMIASALAAYFTRTIGLALIASIILMSATGTKRTLHDIKLHIRSQWRHALAVAVIFAILIGGWELYVTHKTGMGTAYADELTDHARYGAQGQKTTALAFVKRIGNNIIDYLGRGLAKDTRRAGIAVNAPWALLIAGIIAYSLFIIGILKLKKYELIDWYLLFTFLILFIFPWASFRYIVPIIPFLTMYAVTAIQSYSGKHASWKKHILFAIFLIFLFLCAKDGYRHYTHNDYSPAWKDFTIMSKELATKTTPHDIVTSMKCNYVHAYSDRQCIDIPQTRSVKELAKYMQDNNSTIVMTHAIRGTPEFLGIIDMRDDLMRQLGKDRRYERIAEHKTSTIYGRNMQFPWDEYTVPKAPEFTLE